MDSLVGGVGRGLITRERIALADLRATLVEAEAGVDAVDAVRTALADLDGLFLLVVCGEYNAGKSSLINALLRDEVMPEGVTPTTDRITVLGYGPAEERVDEGGVAYRLAEVPALRDLALVDTPGTNAVIARHQELTERFVPRADLVLFVTSADRPFTGSERTFLELIASWGKKIVLVVNKVDLLDDEASRDEVTSFVAEHAREVLREGAGADARPRVFAVSARAARRARQADDAAALEASGLPTLERFVAGELSDLERLRLKLASPLGVGVRLARDAQATLRARLELLDDDRSTLDAVGRQREQFEREMRREAHTYLSRVKTALLE
ncbi:MAG: dynamin family protein, partial [Trueperaceae bacterium]